MNADLYTSVDCSCSRSSRFSSFSVSKISCSSTTKCHTTHTSELSVKLPSKSDLSQWNSNIHIKAAVAWGNRKLCSLAICVILNGTLW